MTSEKEFDAMKFLNKMERKYGRYAISNLMKYIIILYSVGTLIDFFIPNFYYGYLSLNFDAIKQGQIWRLVTFIMAPYGISANPLGILLFAIEAYLYYMIGNTLERAWGNFRFNLYILSGIFCNIIAGFVVYLLFGMTFTAGLAYVFRSMFLAFAVLYPDTQLMLYAVIPIKIKWLGYLYGIMLIYEVIYYLTLGVNAGYAQAIAIIVAMANFLIFFLWSRKGKRVSYAHARRRKQHRSTMSSLSGEPRHRCAICGRTEQDNPDLEFRFCSKCNGNYEYCNDHLFTHEHVK